MKNHYTQNPDHYIENVHHYRPFQSDMKWFLAIWGLALSKTITPKRGCIRRNNIFSGTNVPTFLPPLARPVLATPPAVRAGSRAETTVVLLTGKHSALKRTDVTPPRRIISFISSGARCCRTSKPSTSPLPSICAISMVLTTGHKARLCVRLWHGGFRPLGTWRGSHCGRRKI